MTNDTQTHTLTDFLLARITEDEAKNVDSHSRAALHENSCAIHPQGFENTWCDCDTPARVLTACKAHRRIVDDLGVCDTPEGRDGGEFFGLEIAVQHMASVYADHPDYRDEWKP